MADLQLENSASYNVHDMFQAKTTDHEDHTFCGIMFDVSVKDVLPIDYVEIQSVSVRGNLGPMGVWYTENGHDEIVETNHGKRSKMHVGNCWKKVYDRKHPPSLETLVKLVFDEPIKLKSGQKIGLYVHSKRPDDTAIVYDNERRKITSEDRVIAVHAGCAHISPIPFNSNGFWGFAFRPRREFVGQIGFGVRYFCWKPELSVHNSFPQKFRSSAMFLIKCNAKRNCLWGRLQPEVLYYILNMCSYNWFGALNPEEDTTITDVQALQDEQDEGYGWNRIGYRNAIQQAHRMAMGLDPQGDLFGMQSDEDDEEEEDEDWEDQEVDDENEEEEEEEEEEEDNQHTGCLQQQKMEED